MSPLHPVIPPVMSRVVVVIIEAGWQKIGAREGHIDIIRKGYKPIWIRSAPRQRITLCNPTTSTNASYVLDTEVIGLLERGAICDVGQVQESILIHTF